MTKKKQKTNMHFSMLYKSDHDFIDLRVSRYTPYSHTGQ